MRGRLAGVVGLGLDNAAADAVDQQRHADQLRRHLGEGALKSIPARFIIMSVL
jgi:hypothetical protein